MANRRGKGGKSVMGLFTKEHAYRDKEREERADEDRPRGRVRSSLSGR